MLSLTTLFSLIALNGVIQATSPGSPVVRDGDVQIRINGPVAITAGDTASTVWVINDSATVNGVVREGLVVVNGTARIAGRVEGGIVIVNGHLELQPGARVQRDIMLYRSTMTRANDALVAGAIHNQTGFSIGAGAVWLIWLSFTVVFLIAGVVFAELVPSTLGESSSQLITRPGQSALAGVIVAAAVPTIATLSFATVIGIPLGLMLLFVVIPALTFLGYLVSGAALGAALTSRTIAGLSRSERFAAVVVGILILQCAVALPIVGGLVALTASLLGVGALTSRAWNRRQRPVPVPVPVPIGA